MKTKKNLLWLGILIVASVWIIASHNRHVPYRTASGFIFGTLYNITYQGNDDLKQAIENELKLFDSSLSTFNKSSVISKINRNEEAAVDSFFQTCFEEAQRISKATQGAFDITVAPLVNAWGFGFKKEHFPTPQAIDSLLKFTGYQKVTLSDGKVKKENPQTMLDCSAIAKGYAVDVIAKLLERNKVSNFMVEIGGEIVVKGKNPNQQAWQIGINKPIDDSLAIRQDLQTVLEITDKGIATSGNYRNFYYRDGEKYAHTIDPRTGYPAESGILSATVVADACITADALATAFMVMGLEKAVDFCNAHPQIDAYFIYSQKGKTKTYATEGIKGRLKAVGK